MIAKAKVRDAEGPRHRDVLDTKEGEKRRTFLPTTLIGLDNGLCRCEEVEGIKNKSSGSSLSTRRKRL